MLPFDALRPAAPTDGRVASFLSRSPPARRMPNIPFSPDAQPPSADDIGDGPKRPREEGAREIAAYIAEASAELQAMADRARMPLLAQFLAMARLEAEMQARIGARKE